jgi:site-specific DNA recombinase
MGKLILNILLSFAEFEREMISERTRDKIVAARKQGRFTGGRPILGYDIQRLDTGSRLIINPEEAGQIRTMFSLYIEKQSLLQTAKELNKLGWRTKQWTTRKETVQGGKLFDKKNLHGLLTNPVYIGKTRYGKELFEGEHEAIIDLDTWKNAQQLLIRNSKSGGIGGNASRQTVLLRNLLFCHHCGRPMRHTYTLKNNIKYRYYLCDTVMLQGKDGCIAKRIPANQIEQFVIEQIRGLSNDPQLLLQTLEQANHGEQIDTQAAAEALKLFEPVWDALGADEQIQILQLLIDRIAYDSTPNKQRILISYRPDGIHTISNGKESAWTQSQ